MVYLHAKFQIPRCINCWNCTFVLLNKASCKYHGEAEQIIANFSLFQLLSTAILLTQVRQSSRKRT